MVESARVVCGSVRVGWNDEVKAVVRRKEVLAASIEEEAYRKENKKVKRCIYQSKEKVNEQFGRKMSEDWMEIRNCFGKR